MLTFHSPLSLPEANLKDLDTSYHFLCWYPLNQKLATLWDQHMFDVYQHSQLNMCIFNYVKDTTVLQSAIHIFVNYIIYIYIFN